MKPISQAALILKYRLPAVAAFAALLLAMLAAPNAYANSNAPMAAYAASRELAGEVPCTSSPEFARWQAVEQAYRLYYQLPPGESVTVSCADSAMANRWQAVQDAYRARYPQMMEQTATDFALFVRE